MDQESIDELARSIGQSGVIQPILVRLVSDGYEIIAGERRWRASKRAKLKQVPVIVHDASDEQMLELAIVENIHRRDLNAIERAQAYRRYCDVFALSAEKVAERLGENRTTVINFLRLLELPGEIRDLVSNGQLSAGHARAILGVPGEGKRIEIAKRAINLGWSVRTIEDVVRKAKEEKPTQSTSKKAQPPKKESYLKSLENRYAERFKSKVAIQMTDKDANIGRLVIEFYSLEDFERISELAGVDADLSDDD